mmetsp:Transcript_49690/g.89304  ORF Transcript_49690/g.89304 Transcript_49690/m.89304 type:complete len:270 (+) Transcript_49690:411-1220(+)
MQVWACLDIGGSHQGVALPRKKEEEGATRCHHVNHPRVTWAVVWRQHNVCATGAVDNWLHVLALTQLTETISEGPTAVDDLLRFHAEGLRIRIRFVQDSATRSHALVIEENLFNLGVVRNAGSVHRGCHCDGQVCSGVIVGPLVEDGDVLHPFCIHLWELLTCSPRAHDVGARGCPRAKSVVDFEEHDEESRCRSQRCGWIIEWRRPDDPLIQRHCDRYPIRDVRVHLQHVGALLEAVHHHAKSVQEVGEGRHRSEYGGRREELHKRLY